MEKKEILNLLQEALNLLGNCQISMAQSHLSSKALQNIVNVHNEIAKETQNGHVATAVTPIDASASTN